MFTTSFLGKLLVLKPDFFINTPQVNWLMSLPQVKIMSNIIQAFLLPLSIDLDLFESKPLIMLVAEKSFGVFRLFRPLLTSGFAAVLFDFVCFSLLEKIKGSKEIDTFIR